MKHTPAGDLLHCDSFLDEVLSIRVNKWQNWLLSALVLDSHLVGEQPTCKRVGKQQLMQKHT